MTAPPLYRGMALTIVTTTRNRPLSFSLIESYIRRQTAQPDQWLVVNDGDEPYEYTAGQEVILRKPKKKMKTAAGKQVDEISICANWLEAIPKIRGDKIIVVEDDDWLHPTYLAIMATALDEVDVAGISFDVYFKMQSRKYRRMGNAQHASLASTAFRSTALPAVERCCNVLCPANRSVFIDMYLWAEAASMHGLRTRLIPNRAADGRAYHVGLKQMPGAAGLGGGHGDDGANDPTMAMLIEWIGNEDARQLRNKLGELCQSNTTITKPTGNISSPLEITKPQRSCISRT